ncbi:MAG: helix-turn-helix domain-containing protein [Clostridia bacterium]|nr:helix-turn-helix domain-containing protein [Clostridia bacterium]
MKDLSIGLLNELYGGMLTEKQSDVIRSYYDYDLSLTEIAEEYGISRQAAHDAIKKGEQSLVECEKKVGFMAKLSLLKSGLESLRNAIECGQDAKSKEIIENLLYNL